MVFSEEDLASLLRAPRETLGIELKSWIDPTTDEGIAKIARGCLAMRNNDGGVLVIGFMNNGKPDAGKAPSDVEAAFHVDVIQGVVSKFASALFGIEVQFGNKDGQIYPVISVPSGVRTPVTAKSSLMGPQNKFLVKDNAIYCRSLDANNTVSSCEPRRGDWDRLVQICFDNREADIGNFVRRHLSAVNIHGLGKILAGMNTPPSPSALEQARSLLDIGRNRFGMALKERGIKTPAIGFRETSVIIDGAVPKAAPTDSFLQKLFIAQPQHTGWPAWVDSRQFDTKERPFVADGAWQAVIGDNGFGALDVPHVTFWSIHPKGEFYLLTGLEDDLPIPSHNMAPGIGLEFLLQIARLSEIISVALAFARSMGCDPAKSSLAFSFRWSKLKGRTLASWADRGRDLMFRGNSGICHEDEFVTDLSIPVDLPQSAISQHVEDVVKHLFALFGGREFGSRTIADIVDKSLRG